MSISERSSARQMLKDIQTLQKIINLRVNTWNIFASCNYTDPYLQRYHATAGDHTLMHLCKSADNLLARDWSSCNDILQDQHYRWNSCMMMMMNHQKPYRHVAEINANVSMHQQVLAFHFKLAELLEDLSCEVLEMLQSQLRMRDVAAKLQSDLVQRSRLLSMCSK